MWQEIPGCGREFLVYPLVLCVSRQCFHYGFSMPWWDYVFSTILGYTQWNAFSSMNAMASGFLYSMILFPHYLYLVHYTESTFEAGLFSLFCRIWCVCCLAASLKDYDHVSSILMVWIPLDFRGSEYILVRQSKPSTCVFL